jgi:hypothetical protein
MIKENGGERQMHNYFSIKDDIYESKLFLI